MRTRMIWTVVIALVGTLAASAPSARTLDGTVKLGGIFLDEEGDFSTVQETYDLYKGFTVAQVSLNGTLTPGRYFTLDVRDINQGSRRGDFACRVPGLLRLTAGFDQHRQLYMPDRGVFSTRKDWSVGAEVSPSRWLGLSGYFNYLSRDGDRVPYPVGTVSALGLNYENALKTGQLSADVRKGRTAGGITYRFSDFQDALQSTADRVGHVISARASAPAPFYDRWTHLVRGAYGIQQLTPGEIEHTFKDIQYTSVVRPVDAWQLRYAFEGRRIDDQSTMLKTDRFTNDVDATHFHPYGQVSAGYGYETNDDDRTLTNTHHWRGAAVLRYRKWVTAKVDYAGRAKQDQEELTLLKDVEAFQLRARLEVQPHDQVQLGGGYAERSREFPDIHVESDGRVSNAFMRVTVPRRGSLSANYNYATDAYTDLTGRFYTRSHVVTGRVEVSRIKDILLAGSVTYLGIGGNLDIEKSIVSLEGAYTLQRDYHLEVQYNVYNYDDYLLVNRYYTGNVVQVRLARDLHLTD